MRLALCLLLAFAAAPAWAEWEWVKVGENAEATYYFDPATILTTGNRRRVWTLQGLKQRHKGAMSERGLVEFACKEAQYNIARVDTYSAPMAKGNILSSSSDPEKWDDVVPRTGLWMIFKYVCAN